MVAPSRARSGAHYVDNKALFEALVNHRAAIAARRAGQEELPPIPEYVGECILRIASRLATKHNFTSYTFREEMVSDAIENCLLYLHNFDPAKSSNPFAYFTQISHFAFLRRIEREKRQTYIKVKVALRQAHHHLDYTTQDGESVNIGDPAWLQYENVRDLIQAYEAKTPRTRTTESKESAVSEDVVSFDQFDEDEDEALGEDAAALIDSMEVHPDDPREL